MYTDTALLEPFFRYAKQDEIRRHNPKCCTCHQSQAHAQLYPDSLGTIKLYPARM